jgi:holliday junction DNA helicase RuvA
MIAQIQGKVIEKNPTEVIIDCNGVGYELHISLNTYSALPNTDFAKLYTHYIVREDAHLLFGFIDKKERELFRQLISVSGIGANTARTMLSYLNPDQVIQGIASNDVGLIQSVKGIGAKTAQRVIIDLKDKILKLYQIEDITDVSHNKNREEALSALEVLGYIRKNAEKVIDKILLQNPTASVEELIKQALKQL